MATPARSASFAFAAVTVLTAIFLFDVMGAIIKHLGHSYPVQQLSMFRNLFGLVPTVIILAASKEWAALGRPLVIRQWKLGLFRGGLIAMAQLSFYLALTHMELSTATSIAFAGPLFVTALSVPVLGQKVGALRWVAVLIGFAGVIWVMRPGTESYSFYAVLPLCAAFCYGANSVTAKLFDDAVPTALINLYTNISSLLCATLLMVTTAGYVPIGSSADWMWLFAMGAAGGTAVFFLISAYRLADPSSLSPFEYFGIPTSFILGWIFFAETPFDRLIPGVFLIVGGGLLIVWREKRQKSQP